MKLYLIRHGQTAGNLEKRYIGATDEPLCGEGRSRLSSGPEDAGLVIVSPMRRCVETAKIMYPSKELLICHGLRECDFGAFEGKNHNELNKSPEYQMWIDSGGEMAFPGGESKAEFSARTVAAFLELAPALSEVTAFIVHGGTIMALLERFALPKKEFYEYHTENGHGFVIDFDGAVMRITGRI